MRKVLNSLYRSIVFYGIISLVGCTSPPMSLVNEHDILDSKENSLLIFSTVSNRECKDFKFTFGKKSGGFSLLLIPIVEFTTSRQRGSLHNIQAIHIDPGVWGVRGFYTRNKFNYSLNETFMVDANKHEIIYAGNLNIMFSKDCETFNVSSHDIFDQDIELIHHKYPTLDQKPIVNRPFEITINSSCNNGILSNCDH